MAHLSYDHAMTARQYATATALSNPVLEKRLELHHTGIYEALQETSADFSKNFNYDLIGCIIELHDIGKLLKKGWKRGLKPLKQLNGPNHPERSLRFAHSLFDSVPLAIEEGILYHGTRNHKIISESDVHAQYFMLLDALGNAYRPLLDFRRVYNQNGSSLEREVKVGQRVQNITARLIGKLDIDWNAVNTWIKKNDIKI